MDGRLPSHVISHVIIPSTPIRPQGPAWLKDGPAEVRDVKEMHIAADAYQRTIIIVSVAHLCLGLALLAWVAPREYRKLNQRIKQATMGYAVLTIATALAAIVAALNGVLEAKWVSAILYTFVSFSNLIDGAFTWERWLAIHPGYEPSRLMRFAIGFYIFV